MAQSGNIACGEELASLCRRPRLHVLLAQHAGGMQQAVCAPRHGGARIDQGDAGADETAQGIGCEYVMRAAQHQGIDLVRFGAKRAHGVCVLGAKRSYLCSVLGV